MTWYDKWWYIIGDKTILWWQMSSVTKIWWHWVTCDGFLQILLHWSVHRTLSRKSNSLGTRKQFYPMCWCQIFCQVGHCWPKRIMFNIAIAWVSCWRPISLISHHRFCSLALEEEIGGHWTNVYLEALLALLGQSFGQHIQIVNLLKDCNKV